LPWNRAVRTAGTRSIACFDFSKHVFNVSGIFLLPAISFSRLQMCLDGRNSSFLNCRTFPQRAKADALHLGSRAE
jgi:hypothetical protein